MSLKRVQADVDRMVSCQINKENLRWVSQSIVESVPFSSNKCVALRLILLQMDIFLNRLSNEWDEGLDEFELNTVKNIYSDFVLILCFQISLFIAVLRHAKKLYAKAMASDNTHHNKDTIVAYLFKVFSSFPATVKIVKIWSDGPSSQFKNKFIAAVIPILEEKFGVKIYWNFYATAHGKACVDGIGATVKKMVRSMILTKNKIVYQTSDFVDAFNSKKSAIEVSGITDSEISEINALLNLSKVFSEAKAVPGISECHQCHHIERWVPILNYESSCHYSF